MEQSNHVANKKVVVALENVTFRRGTRTIVENLSLQLFAGEVVAFMGPSGTGKTTLMKLITGQLKPQEGRVVVLGEDLAELSSKALMQLRQRMSMLFQSGALFSDMSVGDNVGFALREKTQLDAQLIELLVEMKLNVVGLRGAKQLMPSELSGGMARRVALARAIVRDPELMIYDEPFTGQDPISLGVLALLIRNLNDHLGMTSLVVSHDILEVSKIADRVILLANGRVMADGAPKALYESEEAFVQQFMYAEVDGPVAFHYPAPEYLQALKSQAGGV
ncbi:ABC transporter ATP-binding protein [Rappaport israeli]|uniref:ABC transporter ATP-binding protein n=1 Tax=Rappaport israeli TaxID=1839807 RepID=UPI00093075E6|nr:ATP-binding cassette domain-containing protein [Rappaport israeli]